MSKLEKAEAFVERLWQYTQRLKDPGLTILAAVAVRDAAVREATIRECIDRCDECREVLEELLYERDEQ